MENEKSRCSVACLRDTPQQRATLRYVFFHCVALLCFGRIVRLMLASTSALALATHFFCRQHNACFQQGICFRTLVIDRRNNDGIASTIAVLWFNHPCKLKQDPLSREDGIFLDMRQASACHNTTTRRSLQQSLLDQKRLIHIFNGSSLFTYRSS